MRLQPSDNNDYWLINGRVNQLATAEQREWPDTPNLPTNLSSQLIGVHQKWLGILNTLFIFYSHKKYFNISQYL